MADETLKEDDEQLEIVEVDKLPTAEELAAKDKLAADAKVVDDDDDEDEGDARLSEGHADDDDKNASADKRKRRRQLQKEARDRTLRQVDTLSAENAALNERIARLEGVTIANRKVDIADRLGDAKKQLADAEIVIARATEAGNGEDAVAAMRLRDDARDAVRTLEHVQTQIEQPNTTERAAVDPTAKSFSDQWKAANPWYDGDSEESLIVNALDVRLQREGLKPNTQEFWNELTKRTKARLGAQEQREERQERREERQDDTRRREAPRGDGRGNGATPGTRREVYVTPERKQAMQEAGIWDDAAKRAKMLKAYADFDRKAAN